jgi:hypothetical protein
MIGRGAGSSLATVPPGDEFAVLRERRVNQLIQHVVGRLADEPRAGEKDVAIRFLQSRDVAQRTPRCARGLISGIVSS